jgi:hypothetical protein
MPRIVALRIAVSLHPRLSLREGLKKTGLARTYDDHFLQIH